MTAHGSRLILPLALLLLTLPWLAGCSALGALANPKVAFAINEDTPMDVVLRRASTADTIARSVDRALAEAPGEGDESWLSRLASPAKQLSTAMDVAKGKYVYRGAPAPVLVLPSEAWAGLLPGACEGGEGKTLFVMMGGSLSGEYAKVAALKKRIGVLRGRVEEKRQAAEKEGVSEAERDRLSRQSDSIGEVIDKLEGQVDPLLDHLVEAARESAQKAKVGDERQKVAAALARLHQAVDDAKVANGAALLGYPRAIPKLPNTLPNTVKGFVVDYVEEATGKTLETSKLTAQVKLEGSTPKVTLNGLDGDDLGKLSVDELTSQVVERARSFVSDAFALPGRVGRVGEQLSVEAKIIEALQEGLEAQGLKAPSPAELQPVPSSPARGAGRAAKR